MAYQSAKKSFSRDEIAEILKKNTELYKDDPNFPNYLADLAIYLVEFAFQRDEDNPALQENKLDIVTATAPKVFKIFRTFGSGDTGKICPFCGAPNPSSANRCDQCGQLL